MPNESLNNATIAKNDEFYTQYEDIQREINAYLEYDPDTFRGKTVLLPCDDPEWSNFTRFFAQNFEMLGLKKLISTSYAPDSKPKNIPYQLTLFETASPEYDEEKTYSNGKIFTLTGDSAKTVNLDDLKWTYLEGDGDFRSEEVTRLRDEADIIVTNPPFSLFREFLAWIMDGGKKFLVIGSKNAITYKEVFPLLKENKIWLGNGFLNGNAYFSVPENMSKGYAEGVYDETTGLVKFRNVGWFTNMDHGRRHEPLSLMTTADNVKFSRHKDINGHGYQKYDNYDAIDVPYTDAIPSDYDKVMGVPITFLDKYCPEQFDILGITNHGDMAGIPFSNNCFAEVNGKRMYVRIFVKHRDIS